MYYVYAYLRSKDSEIASARTPYYIGKGKENRRFEKHGKFKVPEDVSRNVIIFENLTEEEAHFEEMYLIDVYGRVDNGTGILRNLTDGGEGMSGYNPPPETREKLRNTQLGKPKKPEAIEKTAAAHRGKIVSEKTRELLSIAATGRKKTPEQVEKTASKLRGRKLPPEQVQKARDKVFSPEHRKHLSESATGRKQTPEHKENHAKAIRGRKQTPEHIKNATEGRRKARERKLALQKEEKENS